MIKTYWPATRKPCADASRAMEPLACLALTRKILPRTLGEMENTARAAEQFSVKLMRSSKFRDFLANDKRFTELIPTG